MSPLSRIEQTSFAAGAITDVAPTLIPNNGVGELQNLLLDEHGALYRRAGVTYKSNTNFGSSGLTFVWDGHLAAGQRTLFANSSNFGVLDSDDQTPITLGGGGLSDPAKAVEANGIVFVGSRAYAGSRKTAGYSTGTVTVTQNSATVTGAGTSWSANVDAGMILKLTGRLYVVASVGGNTTLTLTEPYGETSAGGQSYNLFNIATLASPYPTAAEGFATVGTVPRLCYWIANRLFFSTAGRPDSFAATDYHQLPEGSRILGAQRIGSDLFIFATSGVWLLSNTDFDLTDDYGNVQHRLEHISSDLILWGNNGIATWADSLVVPAVDGVWLLSLSQGPQKISFNFDRPVVDAVRAGYKPGISGVHASHFFLPILDGSNTVKDHIVCSLDLTYDRAGNRPWTHIDGFGANVCALALRVPATQARTPQLIGASRATTGRLTRVDQVLVPDATRSKDADNTSYTWRVTTKDFELGPLNLNHVRRLRARYEMEDAASDNPLIQAFYSIGERANVSTIYWNSFNWNQANWSTAGTDAFYSLVGEAPEDSGIHPYVWPVNRRARFMRVRLESADPAAKMTLRSIELFVRQAGRY